MSEMGTRLVFASSGSESSRCSRCLVFDPGAEISVIRDRSLFEKVDTTSAMVGKKIRGVNATDSGIECIGEGQLIAPFNRLRAGLYPAAAANLLADASVKNEFAIERVYNGCVDAYRLKSLITGETVWFHCTNNIFIYCTSCRRGKEDLRRSVFLVEKPRASLSYYQQLGLSKDNIQRMMAAHALHGGAGYKSENDMCRLLKYNHFKNSLVTETDMRQYFKYMHSRICRACRGGKTVAPDFTVTPGDELTANEPGDVLYCDIVFPTFDGDNNTKCRFAVLQSIDKQCQWTTGIEINNRSGDELFRAFHEIIVEYSKEGYTVKMIIFDAEGAFDKVKSKLALKHPGLIFQKTTGGRKVKTAERNNRTTQMQWRTLVCSLSYPAWPQLYRLAYIEALRLLNLGFRSGNDTLTVYQLFKKEQPLYKEYGRFKFGDLVSYYHLPQGAKAAHPRAEAGIVVGRSDANHGNLEVMSLTTGKVMPKSNLTAIDMSAEHLAAIRRLAKLPATEEPLSVPGPDGEGQSATESEEIAEDITEPVLLAPDQEKPLEELIDNVVNNKDATDADEAPDGQPSPEESEQHAVEAIEPAARPAATREKSRRTKKPAVDSQLYAFNLTIKQATKQFGAEVANDSITKELKQLYITRQAWRPIRASEMKTLPRDVEILPSGYFLLAKWSPFNEFIKLKARVTVGGHMQMIMNPEENASPTVNMATVYLALAIAAKRKMKMRVIDVAGAYLNCKLDEPIKMRLSKTIATLMVEIDPNLADCVLADGTMVVDLLKAQYGLKCAGRKWADLLAKTLIEIGYKRSVTDRCLFTRLMDGEASYILAWVDDMLILCDTVEEGKRVRDRLKEKFGEVTESEGDELSFIGMQIVRRGNDIMVNQKGNLAEVINAMGVTKTASYPAAKNFLEEAREEDPEVDLHEYQSLCMKLMYLAVKTRPDILYSTCVMATRAKTHKLLDYNKMIHIVEYLNGSRDECLKFRGDGEINVNAYCDASFCCHPDAKGQTGFLIYADLVGSAAVLVKSGKQKTVADSSAEAELIAAHECVQNLLWVIAVAEELGYPQKGVPVKQDNQATIKMASNEQVCFKGKSKFINRKYFSVHEHVESGELEMVYVGTEENVADFLTKMLTGGKFRRFRVDVMGQMSESVFHCYLEL